MIRIDPMTLSAGPVLKHDAYDNPTPINDFPSPAGRFPWKYFRAHD